METQGALNYYTGCGKLVPIPTRY